MFCSFTFRVVGLKKLVFIEKREQCSKDLHLNFTGLFSFLSSPALSPSSGEEKQSGDGDCTLGAGGTGNQNQEGTDSSGREQLWQRLSGWRGGEGTGGDSWPDAPLYADTQHCPEWHSHSFPEMESDLQIGGICSESQGLGSQGPGLSTGFGAGACGFRSRLHQHVARGRLPVRGSVSHAPAPDRGRS